MQLYRRVTYRQRCKIEALKSIGKPISEISKKVGKHRSTIYRELKRNTGARGYQSGQADFFAEERRRTCRRRRKMLDRKLRRSVERRLNQDWSPEQICLRLEGQVSHQTIYNESKTNYAWREKLRRFGKKPGRGRRRGQRGKKPSWLTPISERPLEIDLRIEFGHWERDTMMGRNRRSLLVCLERMTGYVTIARANVPLRQLHAITKRLLKKTKAPVRTITNDNGNEFMDGYLFKIPVYYCEPNSPHQKGSVENTIGLIRQYIKRDTDLDKLSDRELARIAKRLNDRPRKRLDGMTPAEVFEGHVALAS